MGRVVCVFLKRYLDVRGLETAQARQWRKQSECGLRRPTVSRDRLRFAVTLAERRRKRRRLMWQVRHA